MTESVAQPRWDLPAAIALACIVQTIISLLAACTPVLATEIAADRGWNVALIALYAPVLCIARIALTFAVPGLLVLLGGMGLNLACVGISVVGLLCLLPPSLVIVALAPVAMGFATAAMNPASSQILGPRTTPRTAGFIMSLKQTGVPLGGVVAGAVVPILVLRSGWQDAVLYIAAACSVVTLALLPTVRWLNGDRTETRKSESGPLEPLKRLLAIPGMPSFLVAAAIFTAMQLCLRSFLTVYLVELGFGLATAGMMFSVSQGAGMVGQVAWGVVSDRLLTSRTVMAILGVIMCVAGVLTAAITPSWPLPALIVVAVLYGVSAAGFMPVVLAEISRVSPRGQVGAFTSGSGLFLASGFLLGPLLFGAIQSLSSYALGFVVLALCTAAGSVIVARNPLRRAQSA
jgi:MFS family permease